MQIPTRFVLLLLPALLLGACRAAPRAPEAPDPRAVAVFTGTGDPAGWDALVSAGAEADAVILGENHGHPLGLDAAATLWDDLLARTDKAALSLEFFERDEQSRLEDYLGGLSREETFKRRTARSASSYPDAHRRMVEAAKAAKRPVIASNAVWAHRSTASRHGFDRLRSLSPEQRRMFRIPDDLPAGRYREDFDRVMNDTAKEHGRDKPFTQDELDGSFRAQSLQDWTMAESVARSLEAGERPVVHVVGRFHSDFRGGLVHALQALHPGARVVTVSFVNAWATSLRDDDRGRADFVVYVGPSPPSRAR